MGFIEEWRCECGYTTGSMYLGKGMRTPKEVSYFPYYCKTCESLFVGNELDKNIVCKNCQSRDVELFHNLIDTQSTTKHSFICKYFCPNCKKYSLTRDVLNSGSWD